MALIKLKSGRTIKVNDRAAHILTSRNLAKMEGAEQPEPKKVKEPKAANPKKVK